jgi:hypothetical protein
MAIGDEAIADGVGTELESEFVRALDVAGEFLRGDDPLPPRVAGLAPVHVGVRFRQASRAGPERPVGVGLDRPDPDAVVAVPRRQSRPLQRVEEVGPVVQAHPQAELAVPCEVAVRPRDAVVPHHVPDRGDTQLRGPVAGRRQ